MSDKSLAKYPVSTFSPLTEEHLELILSWRNKPRVRDNMFTNEIISLENHLRWFEKLKKDASRLFLVFFQDNRPIGILNFSDLDKDVAHWGCYLGEEDIWPGSGLILEIAALDCAFNHLCVNTLAAEVLETNSSPQKIHALFEYKPLGKRAEKLQRNDQELDVLLYQYARDDWKQHRERIFKKLPAQIRAAAANIVFDPSV